MSSLDRRGDWEDLDPRAMRDLVAGFPAQFRRAAEIGDGIVLARAGPIQHVVVTGLGGSAIGGDVIRTAFAESLRVPLAVNRDYSLPTYVGRDTLVVASSYSGDTEETLSAYRSARRASAQLASVTSGGALAEQASRDGVAVIRIPGGLPPRAALGYSSLALLGILRALGLLGDPSGPVRETLALLEGLAARYGTAVPEATNPAKRLARSLYGKIVAIYGSPVMEAAVLRWRGQVEENAKNLAFHHLLPEMNHNELVGWRFPAGALSQVAVVFLRDRGDHQQVKRRLDLTRAMLEGAAGVVEEVWSEGASLLARIYSLAYLADFTSLYLSFLNGVDATPVDAIDVLKAKLSEPAEASK